MTRHLLRLLQYFLGAAGIIALGYCAYVVTDSWIYQRQEEALLNRTLPHVSPAPGKTSSQAPAPERNGLVGRLEVTRLKLKVIVREGDDGPVLIHAAGHIPGTALPGEPGNVGIAAHRDTFFRSLRDIRKDDVITLTTTTGQFRYRVVSTDIVSPRNVSVLSPAETDSLTLVTCYPFRFIGPAPDRFVVRAQQIGSGIEPVLQPNRRPAHPTT
jgi:sortase A